MTDTSQLKSVEGWRTALGLRPVPLRDWHQDATRYVLLNGTSGNFCLDFSGDTDQSSRRAAAWSSDVGHYITSVGEILIVDRWDRRGPEERFSSKSVVGQLHAFHRYLEKGTPDRTQSIVAHVLRVFHRIRAALNDEENGFRSLQVLLALLASAALGEGHAVKIDLTDWGVSHAAQEIIADIHLATWQSLLSDLLGAGRFDAILRPDISLVLRHASGTLFQDAHLEVNDAPGYWLPGFEMPVVVKHSASPKETGIYFTPPALARTLAEEATYGVQKSSTRRITIFDPACGSGELLKECVRILRLNGHQNPLRVIGWDVSPTAIEMARFVLAWEKQSWRNTSIDLNLEVHDSLREATWPDGTDIIAMNPPFKSWQKMSRDERQVIQQILGPIGKPNLASAFARRAVSALSTSGVLATVTPNSLLESESARETRESLAAKLSPQLVARLGDQNAFARALVDAGLYVGRRKRVDSVRPAVLWADTRQNSLNHALRALRIWRHEQAYPLNGDGYSVYERADIARTGEPWIAREHDAWTRFEALQQRGVMIPAEKVFDVKQGVRLGNDAFIVEREYVQALKASERRYFRPAVMNLSIGDAKLSDTYYCFYPYSSGNEPISTERDLQQHVPQYFRDYLSKAKDSLKGRKTLERQSELKWWDLLWRRTWQIQQAPKLVSKYFGSNRPFAFDAKGNFVVVVGYAWLLKKGAISILISDEEICLAYLTYLNSSTALDLLRYVSVQISGGQLDLSSKYVNNLPLPDLQQLSNRAPGSLEALIDAGRSIVRGEVSDWTEIDQLVVLSLSR